MTTIAYQDKTGGKLYYYNSPNDPKNKLNLFNFKTIDRIIEALTELRHMGNINLLLIKGNKIRKISEHYF